MKQELKHVNFYGLSLMKGLYSGMKSTDKRTLALSGDSGFYITRMFDTGEAGCSYNRLAVDGSFEGAMLEIIVAATDDTDVFIGSKPANLESYFANPRIRACEKAELLTALPHVRKVNTRDILLHGLKGRYVWICAALVPAGRLECELAGLRLELPKYSFTEYFPEIYQGSDFFDRYIAVFQSMFLDAEKQVDELPALLDYRTTPDENVEYLAGWLGLDNSRGLFTPGQLRHLIENIDVYQGAKGTKFALIRVIELFTGVRPRIVEYFEWMRPGISADQLELNGSLYGDTPNHFCVILNLTNAKLNVSESDLERLIENFSPLGSRFKIVLLNMCSHTDVHCYLDINSAISVPETAGLGTAAFGAHITIG